MIIGIPSHFAAATNVPDNLTINQWLDTFIDACVGGGSSATASGTVTASGEITLAKLTAGGKLEGSVTLENKNVRLLSEGINERLTTVEVGVANQVRDCLAPVRSMLVQVMAVQMGGQIGQSIQILSPDEDKIMRAVARLRGQQGVAGQLVPSMTVRQSIGMGDIRFNVATRSLMTRLFAGKGGLDPNTTGMTAEVISLWDQGQEYVLRMGYAE